MSGTALSILVLDDDDAVRESFADFFEDRGHRVLQASSAEDALVTIQTANADAAVVDIRLSGMDGMDFIRRAAMLRPRLACVVVTGSSAFEMPADLAGMQAVSPKVFAKPVTALHELDAELKRLAGEIAGGEKAE